MKKNKEIIKMIISFILLVIGLLIQDPTVKFIIFLVGYLLVGYEIIITAIKNIAHGKIFDENFLMMIATIGAFCIKEYPEAVAVMLFYQLGEYIGDKAVDNSKQSITELMDLRSDYANLLIGKDVKKVSPEEVKIDDHIIVKPGEKVPLDGIVIDGNSTLDTSSLTGESIPRTATIGKQVLSGSINLTNLLTVKVTSNMQESTATKILELMESAASKKTTTEKFITKFAKVYTPVVVLLALLLFLIPVIFLGGSPQVWLYRALVFLVISCPCALVISVPLGFFCGIGACSKKGILVKSSNDLEQLKTIKTIVFDKTGTLTKGNFVVTEIHPEKHTTKEELVKLAVLAESNSNHPIALSIKSIYQKKIKSVVTKHQEIPGRGIEAVIDNEIVLLGNQLLLEENDISIKSVSKTGTVIYLAKNKKYLGYFVIKDEIKEEARNLNKLKQNGVEELIVLSGDHEKIVKDVCNELKLTSYYASLLPKDKVNKMEELKGNGTVCFVGDGINDAPVLAMSDIGISMGGIGSDAAIEASDVVIMSDNPMAIETAMKISAKTNKIIWTNIIFAIGVKLVVLLLGACGYASIWSAVFADVGVTIIAIANALRILKYKD